MFDITKQYLNKNEMCRPRAFLEDFRITGFVYSKHITDKLKMKYQLNLN